MRKAAKILSILLALCMALSLGTLASGEASGGANSAEMAPPDVSTKGIGELGQAALLYVENVDGKMVFTEAKDGRGSVRYDLSEDAGSVTLSDVEIRSDAAGFSSPAMLIHPFRRIWAIRSMMPEPQIPMAFSPPMVVCRSASPSILMLSTAPGWARTPKRLM